MPLIAADVDAARSVAGVWSPATARLADAFWPGPLTLVVPVDGRRCAGGSPPGRRPWAVRVSRHPVARALAAIAPSGLITATSANLSGTPALATADAVVAALGQRVDAGRRRRGRRRAAWRRRSWTSSDAVPRLIRAGPIAFARVLESLR